ncbi:unnamed protein product, partial [Leptidea sinapis]
FTVSETAYFWRWWKEQRGATRSTFRSLVAEGRIQFAGGGWVQADEATTYYLQLIDLYTWGLRKINDTLGPCGKPKAAWQIDTYGHSKEHTSLLAQMGYDGLFLEWSLCGEGVTSLVNDFISKIERQAKYYEHDNILVMMGGDFTYQSAANWFMNIDKLINHVSSHPANISDVNIFYSTPSCYLKAIYLYGKRDKAIHTEKADLLPYGSDSNTYWTGFYTSRPSLKYFAVRAHVLLQVVKQLTVLSRMSDSYELHLLRHAVSTSQQHVVNDFISILSDAVEVCTKKISQYLSILTPSWGGSRRPKGSQQFLVCHMLNISQCRFSETQDSILLLVYNPLSIKTYHHFTLSVLSLLKYKGQFTVYLGSFIAPCTYATTTDPLSISFPFDISTPLLTYCKTDFETVSVIM